MNYLFTGNWSQLGNDSHVAEGRLSIGRQLSSASQVPLQTDRAKSDERKRGNLHMPGHERQQPNDERAGKAHDKRSVFVS